MTALTLAQSNTILNAALAKASSDGHRPMTAVVIDASGHLIAMQRQDGASMFRLDKSRHLLGNGLGLSIVAAIAALHGGSLEIEDAAPGLRVRLRLRR